MSHTTTTIAGHTVAITGPDSAQVAYLLASNPILVGYQYREFSTATGDAAWSPWRECSEADYQQWHDAKRYQARRVYALECECNAPPV